MMFFHVIILVLAGLIPITSSASISSSSKWLVSMQDSADAHARWLNNPPKNHLVSNETINLRVMIYICAVLKSRSSESWCSKAQLTNRWIGYANKHGFEKEIGWYRNTKYNSLKVPYKELIKYGFGK